MVRFRGGLSRHKNENNNQRAKKPEHDLRPPGLEPGSKAWEASIIPLDHGRAGGYAGSHCDEEAH